MGSLTVWIRAAGRFSRLVLTIFRNVPVAWRKVCRPRCLGGLGGVIDLNLQSLVFRLRWAWLKRAYLARPWQGLPMALDLTLILQFGSLEIRFW